MRPPVLVLGMHRSGTSAVAGALVRAGWTVPGTAIRNWDNPRGHFESTALIRLNEEVLAASGGHWLAAPPEVRWTPEHLQARGHLITPGAVLKDPRSLLAWPFWRDAPVRFLGVVRHPIAVARSLGAWRGMPLAEGLALWLAHNRPLVEAGIPTLVFDGDVERVRADLAALVEDLGGDLDPETIDPAEIHHDGGPVPEGLPPALLEEAQDLWRRLGGGDPQGTALPWEIIDRLRATLAAGGDPADLVRDLATYGPAGLAPAGMACLKARRADVLVAALEGDDAPRRLWRAKALLDLGRPAEAAVLLADHPDFEARLLETRALHQAGQVIQADARLAALAKEALYPHTCHAQRAAWAADAGRLEEAVLLLAEAIAAAPLRRRGRLRQRRASLLHRLGRIEEAVAERAQAQAEDPAWFAD